ncbi:MAG: hypothetical protein ACOCSE_01515 [Chitinivibrionales bacterium]
MSLRWIKNVKIDGKDETLEIQIGDKTIGDKCYTRVSNQVERYFSNKSDNRDEIIEQGLEILKDSLKNRKVTLPTGEDYDWTQ